MATNKPRTVSPQGREPRENLLAQSRRHGGQARDINKVAQDLNDMIARCRKMADLIQSVNPAEGKERWVTLKKSWEAVAVNSIRLLNEYTALSRTHKATVAVPPRPELERDLRDMHAAVKAVFEKADELREKREQESLEKKIFNQLDSDNSGTVDVSELRAALRNMNLELTDENLTLLLRRIDRAQHRDELTFQEFRDLLTVLMHMKKIFKDADTDNSGNISRPELEVCFKRLEFSFSPVVLQLLEELFDTDKSGTIDYQEFFNLLLYFRELEDAFGDGRRPLNYEWTQFLLGPSATAEDQKQLMEDIVWNSSLTFDAFVARVCKRRVIVSKREMSSKLLTVSGTAEPKRRDSARLIQVGHMSSKELPKKKILRDDKPSNVGLITADEWLRIEERPVKRWNDVGHGGVPFPDYANVGLIADCEDHVEFGDPAASFDGPFVFEDAQKFYSYYRDNIYEKQHVNFVGNHAELGPLLISILDDPKAEKLKGMIRSKKGDERIVLLPNKHMRDALMMVRPELQGATLKQVAGPDLAMDVMLFEQKLMVNNYKFGVLSVRKDQPDEVSWYNNRDSTPDLDEFLDWLAFRITLKGWNRFRGGLNVKDDLTGKESFYTNHHGFEIMFHVSTMLPLQPNDVQQVERKRHLGNDVVIVIFQEADVTEPFDPAKIKSQFNHVFCVVQPVGTPDNRQYKIAFSSKLGTLPYGPLLPPGGIYPKNDQLREFLLFKLINGERAAMYAPDFKGKGINTRKMVLKDIVDKYMKDTVPEASPQSPTGGAGSGIGFRKESASEKTTGVKTFIGKIFKKTPSISK